MTDLKTLTPEASVPNDAIFFGADSVTAANPATYTRAALANALIGAASVSVASGKILSISNTLTLAGTDGSTLNIGTGGTLGALAFKASAAVGSDVSGLGANVAAALAQAVDTTNGLVKYSTLGTAAFLAATAFDASGAAAAAIAAHQTVQTGIHGLAFAAGKTLTLNNSLTFAGTDGASLNIGGGGALAAMAYKAKVSISDVDATGTPGNTTYLRGDGSWQIINTTLTPNSTTTSGGAAGQIMYDDGSKMQESSALTFASNTLQINGAKLLGATNSLTIGGADAATAVAQTLAAQNVLGGTMNTSGADLTISASRGTGTGLGGSIILQVAPAGSSSGAQNALATAMTIDSTKLVTFTGNIGLYSSNTLRLGNSTVNWQMIATTTGIVQGSGNYYAFGNGSNLNGATLDVFLYRDAAGTLALRNSTNAQTFNVYNSYTDASNYERLGVFWTSNVCVIETQKAGTGAARNLYLSRDGGNQFILGSASISLATSLVFGTDNAYDIGASGANRPRNVYAGGAVVGAGFQAVSGGTYSYVYPTYISTSGDYKFYTNTGTITFGSSSDTILSRPAAATLQHGAADAAAPVAQTIQAQSVVAGTTNTAGANFTIKGSAGTGTGAGGSIIFQVAPLGSSGTAQNTYTNALLLDGNAGLATFSGSIGNTGDTYLCSHTGALETRGFRVRSTASFSFSSGAASGTADVFLMRDAANTLALRNGAAAQAFRVYNTYTDASNNEYLTLDWSTSANVATIGTVANGTGTVRTLQIKSNYQMNLYSAAGGSMFFFTNGTARWYFDGAAGHFLANADNTYDIGASGASRPRNVYVAGSTFVTGSSSTFARLTISSDFLILPSNATPKTNGGLAFVGGAYVGSGSTNNIVFQANTAGAEKVTFSVGAGANDILGIGGGTSSFPALKRSTTTLQVRLADDSAYAPVEASTVRTATAYTVATLPAAGTAGRKAYVTDATAPTFLGALTGGGAVVTPVFDNGTAWVAG